MKKITIIILINFSVVVLTGQVSISSKQYTEISLGPGYGFIADVGNRNHLLIRSHITPMEISIAQPLLKKYSWQMILPETEKGITVRYVNLRNPEYLGSIVVLSPFVKATIFSTKQWGMKLSASMGLVYAGKIYHRTGNFRNTIFGSHLNAAIGFGLENSFCIAGSLLLNAGINFSHYSNGETNLPNDGMNIGALFFSAGYRFNRKDFSQIPPDSDFSRSFYLTVLPVAGWRDISPVKSKRYLTAGFSAEFGFRLTCLQNIGAGAVVFYDGSIKPLYKAELEKGIAMEQQFREFTSGVYLLHELKLYPLIIHVQAGYLLIDERMQSRSRFFNRFGIRYFIAEKFFLNLTHKSHFFFKGDNLEWGIGHIL